MVIVSGHASCVHLPVLCSSLTFRLGFSQNFLGLFQTFWEDVKNLMNRGLPLTDVAQTDVWDGRTAFGPSFVECQDTPK